MIFLRACFHRLSPGWHTALFPPENAGERRRCFAGTRVPPRRARRHCRRCGLAGLVAGASAVHLRHPVRSLAVPAVQQQPARGAHRRGAGLPPELAHLPPQSVVRFLYWHMNYHIEHHMYAAVPCYRLGRLHRAIRHELPPLPPRAGADVARDRRDTAAPEAGARLPVHSRAAGEARGGNSGSHVRPGLEYCIQVAFLRCSLFFD